MPAGGSALYTPALALDQLAVAGRVLERGQAGRASRAGGSRRRSRRAAAIAAEAPTTPPIRNERSLSRRPLLVHASIVEMRLVCLGDLLLDVIVRLEQPLAAGLRRGCERGHAHRPGRPGGERGRVGGVARGRVAGSSASAATTTPAALVASGLAARGVDVVGPVVDGPERRRRLARLPGWRQDDGLRPRRRARVARRRARPGLVRGLRPSAPLRLLAAPLADRRRGAPGSSARAAAQRRPLLVERDRGVRRGAVPAAARGASAGRRLRERGRGAAARRPPAQA